MEEGTKGKKTIFIGGIGEDVDEAVIYEHFVPFGRRPLCFIDSFALDVLTTGDIIEVQLPQAPANPSQPTGKQTYTIGYSCPDPS